MRHGSSSVDGYLDLLSAQYWSERVDTHSLLLVADWLVSWAAGLTNWPVVKLIERLKSDKTICVSLAGVQQKIQIC